MHSLFQKRGAPSLGDRGNGGDSVPLFQYGDRALLQDGGDLLDGGMVVPIPSSCRRKMVSILLKDLVGPPLERRENGTPSYHGPDGALPAPRGAKMVGISQGQNGYHTSRYGGGGVTSS